MIQQLRPSDISAFRAMLAIFSDAFEDPDHYDSNPPSDAYIEKRLSDPNFIALVAQEGDQTAGALAAYVLNKFEQERSEIYIYDLAVASAHRRKGIATALINKLRQIASLLGSYVIFVQADYGDEPAIALYESLGVREDVLHFDISVPS